MREFRPGDRIWVHDYHLMLLPGMLRENLPDAAIGFFLHIPFPGSDIFSILPRGEELLAGLLGADLISFHTHLHLQHFRMSLRRLLGVESTVDRLEVPGRQVRLQALPIGIAPDDFLGYCDKAETQEHLSKLQMQYSGRKMIVAVDRLDYTKGLPHRLRTFRRMLRSDPELVGKVVLLQIAVPSRENIESYQELRSEVHELHLRHKWRVRHAGLGAGCLHPSRHPQAGTGGRLSVRRRSLGWAIAGWNEPGCERICGLSRRMAVACWS